MYPYKVKLRFVTYATPFRMEVPSGCFVLIDVLDRSWKGHFYDAIVFLPTGEMYRQKFGSEMFETHFEPSE